MIKHNLELEMYRYIAQTAPVTSRSPFFEVKHFKNQDVLHTARI